VTCVGSKEASKTPLCGTLCSNSNLRRSWRDYWEDHGGYHGSHGEDQGQKRVMCLDGWEMYGTKERLVDHIYEFVIIALV
jgi:hypothetical protein